MERVGGVEPPSRPWQGRIIAAIRYPLGRYLRAQDSTRGKAGLQGRLGGTWNRLFRKELSGFSFFEPATDAFDGANASEGNANGVPGEVGAAWAGGGCLGGWLWMTKDHNVSRFRGLDFPDATSSIKDATDLDCVARFYPLRAIAKDRFDGDRDFSDLCLERDGRSAAIGNEAFEFGEAPLIFDSGSGPFDETWT